MFPTAVPPHTHKPPPTCPLTPTDPQAGTKEKEEAHILAITIQFGGFYVLSGHPNLDEEPLATSPRSGLMGSATYPKWLVIRKNKIFLLLRFGAWKSKVPYHIFALLYFM